MNKELTSIVKKTAKIAGVTCVAAGAVALMTSGAALKALTVGGKYLKDTIQKIVNENPDAAEEVVEAAADTEVAEAAAAEAVAEEVVEVPAVEAVAEEQDFAEAESQEA